MEQKNTEENKIDNNQENNDYISFTRIDEKGNIHETYGKFIEWQNEPEIAESIDRLKKKLGEYHR